MADRKVRRKANGATRDEVRWALEKIADVDELIACGQFATAASRLDVARLHLETAAVDMGQALAPRTTAGQAMEERHAKLRGVL
jgi:hypothetical protein